MILSLEPRKIFCKASLYVYIENACSSIISILVYVLFKYGPPRRATACSESLCTSNCELHIELIQAFLSYVLFICIASTQAPAPIADHASTSSQVYPWASWSSQSLVTVSYSIVNVRTVHVALNCELHIEVISAFFYYVFFQCNPSTQTPASN